MSQLLLYLISGLVAGAIYSIFASGLTLIYSASGIYNVAFGSFAFMATLTYYELNSFMPRGVSFVVTVLILAPLCGLGFERAIFRRLAQAPEVARLIGSVGLLLALPALGLEMVKILSSHFPHLGLRSVQDAYSVAGIGPVPPKVIHIGAGTLNSDQLIVLAVTAIIVGGLWVLMTRTRIGLMTRAVVDRADLASIRGINPAFTSRVAWGLGSILAALAGVLSGPLFGLNTTTMLQFVVASSAVVVLARFRSLPLAVSGGLALGALTSVVAGYGIDVPGLKTVFTAVPGTRQAVIYIVLLGALLWRGRQRIRAAGVTVTERIPPDYLADLPTWRRWWPWVAMSVALLAWTTGALGGGRFKAGPLELKLLVQGIGMSLVFMSFVVVVGMLGVASLAQATMATVGALTAGLVAGHGFLGGNFVVAVLAGGIAAAGLAMVVAVPAFRLGGLALALATLAFAFIGDTMLFQVKQLDNYGTGWKLSRPVLGPIDFANDRSYIVLLFVFLGLGVWVVSNLQRSRTGRAVFASRFASAAASAVGISNRRTILVAFAVAGMFAGLGGALLAFGSRNAQPATWPTLTGVVWLMIAMIQGVRRPGAAVIGGLLVGLFPRVLETGFFGLVPKITDPTIPTILFGLGCIILANQPDGALHNTSKQNYLRRQKRRSKRELAATSSSVGGAGPGTTVTVSHGVADAMAMPVDDHVPLGAGRPSAGTPSRDDALELWSLVAGYADTEVLHGIDLRVPKGSIVAVLGPNGTGKSTMCGAIAGTVHVSGGQVLLDGEDVTAIPAHRRTGRGLMLAPESRGIFPTLSVEENLSVSLARDDDRQRAFERFPQLAARAKLPAASLSGGEQQMLCLAPLLVRPPRLLLADEITLGLAPAIVEQILVYLRELREA
ncbi:MAG TPA: ATP-binding cassette domain-containing protein, partial [Acidimicrobiales bacterium]|nr:ATP-binding cassette domain-containing protein [Acidimicrobiales bacterium]